MQPIPTASHSARKWCEQRVTSSPATTRCCCHLKAVGTRFLGIHKGRDCTCLEPFRVLFRFEAYDRFRVRKVVRKMNMFYAMRKETFKPLVFTEILKSSLSAASVARLIARWPTELRVGGSVPGRGRHQCWGSKHNLQEVLRDER